MDLKLFGPIWDGAGVRGFSGEGYWFHRWFRWFVPGFSFEGSTFVAKTLPVDVNGGNMELTATFAPKKWFPDCIYVLFLSGYLLNAVGLSGHGLKRFLKTGRWQRITKPFMISHMPIRKDASAEKADALQLAETREFVEILGAALPQFRSQQLGIQFNLSCPNIKADLTHLVEMAGAHLTILVELKLPIVVKINLLVPPETAKMIASHPACSGLCVSNAIPFGELRRQIAWGDIFRGPSFVSPLTKRGYPAGGLSGGNLAPLTAEWVKHFRILDRETYVNAGLGVMRASDVDLLHSAGANSVFFASVAVVRPWRVRSIIKRAHKLD